MEKYILSESPTGVNVYDLKPRLISSPYNFKETMGYFVRNYFGVSTKRQGLVTALPHDFILNAGIIPRYTVAFIGDIMDMRKNTLRWGPQLKTFLADSNFLIGNFEATITEHKGPIMAQRHIPQIVDALVDLFPPEQTFLSVANNHAGDFGHFIFQHSVELLKARGFTVFGTQQSPYCDIADHLRVIAGTMWSNQKCAYVSPFSDILCHVKPDCFNTAFPHWSYELELYPRPAIIELGKQLLNACDAVIGHHSHIPQPVTAYQCGNSAHKQLVAYGLGDICIWEKIHNYFFGIVLKAEIGSNSKGVWQIGRVQWVYTRCGAFSPDTWRTEITDDFPYLH